MEKQELLAQAEVIRNETQDYANDANRIGKMFEDIINSIPLSVALPQLNSLNTFENRGMYVVNLQSTDDGIVIGVLDVFGAWNSDYTTQRFVTNALLDSLNAGDAIPIMNGLETHIYDRHYSSTSKAWSEWKESDLKLDDSVITSWDGTVVENPAINSQSSMANGKVVLAKMNNGKTGFVWEVTASDGEKSYYNNWVEGSNYSGFSNYQDTPFDGTKQVEIKRTVFITPENGTYLCLNGREVTNISANIDSLENIAKSVKWSGEIVNGVTILQNSYTGDDGTVVLVGNYTFAYKVGSTYYGNWTTREDYQKNIYKSGTIGWKAGFYDYLLYVSPTSVWMKKSDSELVSLTGSSELTPEKEAIIDNLPESVMYDLNIEAEESQVSIQYTSKILSSGDDDVNQISIPAATITEAGVMSAADKTKLDSLVDGVYRVDLAAIYQYQKKWTALEEKIFIGSFDELYYAITKGSAIVQKLQNPHDYDNPAIVVTQSVPDKNTIWLGILGRDNGDMFNGIGYPSKYGLSYWQMVLTKGSDGLVTCKEENTDTYGGTFLN